MLSRQDSIIGVLTERPTFMGGRFELLLRYVYSFFKYRKIFYQFKDHTSFLLPLGMAAVNNYRTYGWSDEKMFNFMYNPNIPKRLSSRILSDEETLRFVFIGRFYNKTKGIDTLLNACKKLEGNWSLDLVGGYGPDKDATIRLAETLEHVNFIGAWKADDVVTKLSEYDVAVVPSKYDGWNLLANESVHAGIGCIISDEAVSHEIIENSGSGKVFKAKHIVELAEIMQECIDHKQIVNTWKENTKTFVDNITEETVGKYLISILKYVVGYSNKRPKCPWINR
jgi:glycosyltransferase involved in cell wall biosynthesis